MAPAVQPIQKIIFVDHRCTDLVTLFAQIFREYRTRLVPGGDEPEYLPAETSTGYARIVFTRDYFASALHEIAHWCVAGSERRQLPDYGYWYLPDGRGPEQQKAFEQVEVKPQALEWLFAEAAGFRFRASADNLSQLCEASEVFKHAIAAQAQRYLTSGLPARAGALVAGLAKFYATAPLNPQQFSATRL